MENYLKEKLLEANKPENINKRKKELENKIIQNGKSALNFESMCRLCYGNEAVDFWIFKDNKNKTN